MSEQTIDPDLLPDPERDPDPFVPDPALEPVDDPAEPQRNPDEPEE